ncbi:MAG: LytTR family DNA-binding domain-containing protein [Bacteroidales bacterium]|nr:LytTR family DNA-binding domain-containing protein [Bacteroidales bacterium]
MSSLKIIFEEIPDYLKDKSILITQVMFVSIFALVFINTYAPFDAASRIDMSRLEFFFNSSVMILIGMLGIVLSKLVFFLLMGRIRMSYLIFGLWHLAEIVIMALIYLAVDLLLLKSGMELVDRFTSLLFITLMVLAIPYSLSWLYLSMKDKRKKLENLTNNTSLEFREKKMITFRDETEKLRFSIKSEDILFVESTDNYVTVHSREKGKVKKIMLRNTMKRLEKELEGTLIQRCHRSYMVNFENIKLVKLISTNLYIYMDSPEEIRLPVSKSYAEHVHEFLNRVSL